MSQIAKGIKRLARLLYVPTLGATLAALSWLWRFGSVPPDMMDDLACAAGLRPPTAPYGLLWQYAAAPLCRGMGLAEAETFLRCAGHVSFGILAVLAFFLVKMMLPASLLRGAHISSWWRRLAGLVLLQSVVLFCLSEPVWHAFRWFSPTALQMLLAMLAAIAFAAHLRTLLRAPLFLSFMLLGLLAADAPQTLFLVVGAMFVLVIRRYLRGTGLLKSPEESPFAGALMAWRLTVAFGFGLVAGIVLETRAFAAHDGLAAFGWTDAEFALEAPFAYIRALIASCTPVGAAIMFSVAVVPIAVEFFLVRRATDDETHLAYVYGAMFAAFGLLAFSQLLPAKPLWFWTWGSGTGCVSSPFLRCAAMLLCALSASWALSVFTIELYLRNFRRIETLRFPDAAEDGDAKRELAPAMRLQRFVRAAFFAVPVFVLACDVPPRVQRLEREMLGIVSEAARETADECDGVRWLFTDGGLDAADELAAAERGRELLALSMMGGAEDPREKYLRTRGVDDPMDRACLESGAPDALRTWVRSKPEMEDDYAVQIGFELWRRDGRPLPRCSGLVARPEGLSPEKAERGASAARSLARRILELYEIGSPDAVSDRRLRDAFVFVQWRLAIMARHRANAYDECGEKDLAIEETRLADALDKKNGALARIRATMAWASRKKLERMTPQEGLKLALARADFAFGRIFALKVLDITPDDPSANFCLGMDYFVQRQYARAEAYLSRCLERRPDDPAVLNNLAQCRLRQGDAQGALEYARRAREILPDSPEIRRTLERIDEALAK